MKTDKTCAASEAAAVSFLNKFLLNVLSDQVEVSADFDSWV